MGMGALLMPKTLFLAAFRHEVTDLALIGIDGGLSRVSSMAAGLAKQFQVSKQAAGIRLETLELLAQPDKRSSSRWPRRLFLLPMFADRRTRRTIRTEGGPPGPSYARLAGPGGHFETVFSPDRAAERLP